MKILRLEALLHFLIAIGHTGCLFALDKAFEAYGIKDFMYQMVSGHVWMLYALTIGLGFDVFHPSFPHYCMVLLAGSKTK